MRTLLSSLIAILTAVSIVALSIFIAQNNQSDQFSFLGGTLQVDKGWTVASAALLGFLLAFLLLIPGRLASAWRGWTASRQAQALERRLVELREEYARLQGSHRLLLAEYDRVMDQMLVPAAAAGREQAPSPLGGERDGKQASPGRPVATAAAPRPTGPLYPPPPAIPPWRRVGGGDPPAPRARPGLTLVERLRARLNVLKAKAQEQWKKLRHPKQKPPTQQEPKQQEPTQG